MVAIGVFATSRFHAGISPSTASDSVNTRRVVICESIIMQSRCLSLTFDLYILVVVVLIELPRTVESPRRRAALMCGLAGAAYLISQHKRHLVETNSTQVFSLIRLSDR